MIPISCLLNLNTPWTVGQRIRSGPHPAVGPHLPPLVPGHQPTHDTRVVSINESHVGVTHAQMLCCGVTELRLVMAGSEDPGEPSQGWVGAA